MAVRDRIRERATGLLSEWTGLTVAPVEEVADLRESFGEVGEFLDEVEDIGATVLDYLGGRPHEIQANHRRRLAQQSRLALMHDPLAGAEANLRANFAFGSGISRPQAKDPEVQKIIDAAWSDPNNERKLTSYEAQRHRSNEMLCSANVFPTLFIANGKVRVGFRDSDDVTDVVTDPEDDETPLWYVVRKRRVEWDFKLHMNKPILGYEMENGQEKVWYVEHWRNVTDLDEWSKTTGEESPPKPDAAHILPGKIEHFRINRIGRSQFGVPPWTRTLRFYTAINQLTEAQVQMRQGAASIIAQRIRRGGPRDLVKSVSGMMSRTGEIGATSFRRRREGGPPEAAGPGTAPGPRDAQAPTPAGSWFQGFEHDRLEAVNLRSGAGEALQDAQIVRAPISAASGFGQHYLGDPSNTNLATATTLELPTLMEVSAWQETFEGLYRWFTDRVIEAAIQAGQLGGMLAEEETFDPRSLGELRLSEDREEMEARTGRDLRYSFQMPYPGRRNLPDVTSAVSAVLVTLDPSGRNWPLREIMLDFLLRHGFQTEDPSEDVEEIMKAAKRVDKEARAEALAIAGQQPGMPPEAGGGPPGPAEGEEGKGAEGEEGAGGGPSQYGEKRKRTPPSREMGGGPRTKEILAEGYDPQDPQALIDALLADTREAWAQSLDDPLTLIAGRVPKGANGNGAAPAAGPLQ